MAKAKKKSIRKSIRIDGQIVQKTFSNKDDANEWYLKELRKKERHAAGLEESILPNQVTVAEFSKIFMRRRVKGEGVVKGTWSTDGQRLEDYIIPLFGDQLLQRPKHLDWEKGLDLIQSEPMTVLKIRIDKAKIKLLEAKPGNEKREAQAEFDRASERVKKFRPPLSNATRNRIRSLVHTVYEEAIKVDRLIPWNPIAMVPVKDEGDPEEKSDYWETKKECQLYLQGHLELAQRKGLYSYYLWAVCSLNGGARVNELLATQHKDWDLVNRRVRINKIYDPHVKENVARTKGSRKSKSKGRTRSSRWFFLIPSVIAAYRLLCEATNYLEPNDFVFMNSRDPKYAKIKGQGTRTTISGVTAAHNEVIELMGLKRIRVHDVRHTYASHFIMNGGDLHSLGKMLGHSSGWVTARYGHLSQTFLLKEAERVQFGADPDYAKRDAQMMHDDFEERGVESDLEPEI